MRPKIIVFYHKDCSDGFGAAWAAWKKLGARAEYIGAHHNDDPSLQTEGREVYLVDLCFRPEVIEKIKARASSITIIDHHFSSKDYLPLASHHVFDNSHSGAVLSWNFFHPKQKAPNLLLTIEDIDIWQFKRKHTDEIVEYMSLVPMEFKAYSKLATELDDAQKRKEIVRMGKVLVADREARVSKLIKIASEGVIEGHSCLIVNSPVTIDHTAKRIYEGEHSVAVIWSRRPDKIVVSLRSDESVDVSKIAAKFGGGGHKRASAFTLPPDDFKTILSFYH